MIFFFSFADISPLLVQYLNFGMFPDINAFHLFDVVCDGPCLNLNFEITTLTGESESDKPREQRRKGKEQIY